MNLKNKIIAAALCALIAGVGIFGVGGNNALAQTGGANADQAIAQMMQMIETLKQQIQQITQLIAQLKPQETCGNGACRFGETATTCPADCGVKTNCAKEGETMSVNGKQCCAGLSAVAGSLWNGKCVVPPGGFRTCLKCGDGICGGGENECNCPGDCGQITSCAKEGATVYQVGDIRYPQSCCADLVRIACAGINCHDDGSGICAKCGNGQCESGETMDNCMVDCGLRLWPEINTFDTVNNTFSAKNIKNNQYKKIITNKDTKYYVRAAWSGDNYPIIEQHDFQWLYFTLKNWSGPEWSFLIGGTQQSDGSIIAAEISLPTQ